MENDEDFLELNQNIYFKKSPKKSKKDYKKITISTNCTEENIKNIKKFEPELDISAESYSNYYFYQLKEDFFIL